MNRMKFSHYTLLLPKIACIVFLLFTGKTLLSQDARVIRYHYNPRGELNIIVADADTLLNFYDAAGNRITESQNVYSVDEPADPSADSFLKCYPNPAGDHLHISFCLPVKAEYELKLFSHSGNQILIIGSEKNASGNRDIDVSLTDLTPGQYYVWFQSLKISKVKKIIKL